MSKNTLKIKDLRDLIHAGEVVDPLVFLESVMNGHDPRQLSDIYQLVSDILEFSDGHITPPEWEEVVNMVFARYKYAGVKLSESINASKTLAEYLHPKRKSLELTGVHGNESASASKLTEEEIQLFKEVWNDEF